MIAPSRQAAFCSLRSLGVTGFLVSSLSHLLYHHAFLVFARLLGLPFDLCILPTMHLVLSFLFLPLTALFVSATAIPDRFENPSLSPTSVSYPPGSNIQSLSPHDAIIPIPATARPHFLEVVMSEVLKTTAKYPTAVFRLVVATSNDPMTSAAGINLIRIGFSIDQPPYKSITVDMTPIWSIWKPPVFSKDKLPDRMGIMPFDVRMEIDTAWELAVSNGYRLPYGSVVLFWPRLPPEPEKQEPFYRFEIFWAPLIYVYVGAWSRKVSTSLASVRAGNESVADLVEV